MAPRLITAALALLGAAAFGAVSTAAATDATSVAAAAGPSGWMIPGLMSLTALACLTLALRLPNPRPIVLSIALLGAAWLVGIPASGGWRSLTALAGGSLLGVAELAYWSLDFRVAGTNQRTVYIRRAATVAALVGASVALALVPELDLSQIPVSGVELTVAGLLAAAALVAVAATLAWRLRPERDASESAARARPE
ncbi:MAG: hypothetical protein ABSD62_02205 [Candidatus Limnocylindrales bacterium]|jgi:hypothetical protein